MTSSGEYSISLNSRNLSTNVGGEVEQSGCQVIRKFRPIQQFGDFRCKTETDKLLVRKKFSFGEFHIIFLTILKTEKKVSFVFYIIDKNINP